MPISGKSRAVPEAGGWTIKLFLISPASQKQRGQNGSYDLCFTLLKGFSQVSSAVKLTVGLFYCALIKQRLNCDAADNLV